MGRAKLNPKDKVWALTWNDDVFTCTRAEANSHPDVWLCFDHDPTEAVRNARQPAPQLTEAEALKRGIHLREPDHKREMHNLHSDRKLERGECTFVVDEINPESGERHVETVYMKKNSGNWEKKRQVAEAYRRAGKQVEAHDVTFFQE